MAAIQANIISLLLILEIILQVFGAPALKENSNNEPELTRNKRTEEILFGNHQNGPRVKKSDPAESLTKETEVNSDSKSENKADEAPEEDDILNTMELPSYQENSPSEDETEDLNELEHDWNKPGDDVQADQTNNDNHSDNDDENQRHDNYNVIDYRRKRDVNSPVVMAASKNLKDDDRLKSLRAKRDLDEDELRELLETQEVPYETANELEEMEDMGDGGTAPAVYLGGRPGDEKQEFYYPDEAEDMFEEQYKYQLAKELLAEEAAREVRKAILQYLIDAALNELIPEDSYQDGYNDDWRESRLRQRYEYPEELEPVEYLDKRSPLYPYNYEPYESRWDAFMTEGARKRAAYHKLYRLAEALNADRYKK